MAVRMTLIWIRILSIKINENHIYLLYILILISFSMHHLHRVFLVRAYQNNSFKKTKYFIVYGIIQKAADAWGKINENPIFVRVNKLFNTFLLYIIGLTFSSLLLKWSLSLFKENFKELKIFVFELIKE